MEEKVKELGINNILVVDYSVSNLSRALNYLGQFNVFNCDTSGSAEDSMEKAQEAFHQGEKYDLIMSEWDVETEHAGEIVVREGFKHHAYTVIVTEKIFPESQEPITCVEPHIGSVEKQKSECWPEIFDKTLDHLMGKGRSLYDNINEADSLLEEVSRNVMVNYNHLKIRGFHRNLYFGNGLG